MYLTPLTESEAALVGGLIAERHGSTWPDDFVGLRPRMVRWKLRQHGVFVSVREVLVAIGRLP